MSDDGKLPPEAVKPVPVIESDLTVTGALPLEVKVTDFVTAVPMDTSPNCMDVVLRLSDAAEVLEALSWIATLREDPLNDAEIVAVCALPTAATFAVNDAVTAPAGTAALAGIDTTLLVLARATVWALDELALNDTAHVVFPAPVNDVVVQDSDRTSDAPTADDGGESEIVKDLTLPPCVAEITPV